MQIFLTKHYRNRRLHDPEFVLDFEEIYILDSKTKSITRAKVLVRLNSKLIIYVHIATANVGFLPFECSALLFLLREYLPMKLVLVPQSNETDLYNETC